MLNQGLTVFRIFWNSGSQLLEIGHKLIKQFSYIKKRNEEVCRYSHSSNRLKKKTKTQTNVDFQDRKNIMDGSLHC